MTYAEFKKALAETREAGVKWYREYCGPDMSKRGFLRGKYREHVVCPITAVYLHTSGRSMISLARVSEAADYLDLGQSLTNDIVKASDGPLGKWDEPVANTLDEVCKPEKFPRSPEY